MSTPCTDRGISRGVAQNPTDVKRKANNLGFAGTRARSSVGERSLHTREVGGSKPPVPIMESPANAGVSLPLLGLATLVGPLIGSRVNHGVKPIVRSSQRGCRTVRSRLGTGSGRRGLQGPPHDRHAHVQSLFRVRLDANSPGARAAASSGLGGSDDTGMDPPDARSAAEWGASAAGQRITGSNSWLSRWPDSEAVEHELCLASGDPVRTSMFRRRS
jgi:hypothetical protein